MAGVRNEGLREEPISEPKGLPDDCGVVTKFDANREAGHSHSWLGSKEIEELEAWWEARYPDFPKHFPENEWDYFFGNSWGGFSKWPEDTPKGIEDVRFVFWFDN